ncbi:MAG: TMEM165/GDT1 family protein [Brevinematia bacterium]|jgi:putative Ca2+/H+ antiporter (TMEM165/GDT1 family)
MIELLTSFITIFLSEIADKTMLLTLPLSTRIKKTQLIIGIVIASIIVILLPVVLGEWLHKILPRASLVLASGIIFIAVGLFFLFEKEEKEEKEINLKLPDFLKASLIFFIAEMGDKTQLATFSLSISQSNLLLVWLGATLGLILPNVIIPFIGSKISEKLNPKIVKFIAASVFILIGALTLLEYFGIIE